MPAAAQKGEHIKGSFAGATKLPPPPPLPRLDSSARRDSLKQAWACVREWEGSACV